jgi:uncharacterized membrane protein
MPAPLDVSVERTVPAPPERVAAVMFDPSRDSQWMKAVRSAERLPGSPPRTRRTGRFLGRTITWTTEVLEDAPPHRLRLRIVDGPFIGDVEYSIERAGSGSRVRIRNVGQPGLFAFMPRWLTMAAMKSAVRADLARLSALVQQADRV